MGLIGAFLILICAFLIIPEYSDYRARVETSGWMAEIQAIQSIIEQKALKQKSLIGVGNGIDKKTFQTTNPDVFEITESGMIILRGGRDGQVVVLIPSISEQHIAWRCIGGSARAVPGKCNRVE
jgi:hypothetical protein